MPLSAESVLLLTRLFNQWRCHRLDITPFLFTTQSRMWNRSNKILSTILAFCLSLAVFCTQAESSVAQTDGAQVDVKRPYSGQQGRMIKALSSKEVQGLLQGKGMGMAKAAELNQYPGPRHVLDSLNR